MILVMHEMFQNYVPEMELYLFVDNGSLLSVCLRSEFYFLNFLFIVIFFYLM